MWKKSFNKNTGTLKTMAAEIIMQSIKQLFGENNICYTIKISH